LREVLPARGSSICSTRRSCGNRTKATRQSTRRGRSGRWRPPMGTAERSSPLVDPAPGDHEGPFFSRQVDRRAERRDPRGRGATPAAAPARRSWPRDADFLPAARDPTTSCPRSTAVVNDPRYTQDALRARNGIANAGRGPPDVRVSRRRVTPPLHAVAPTRQPVGRPSKGPCGPGPRQSHKPKFAPPPSRR